MRRDRQFSDLQLSRSSSIIGRLIDGTTEDEFENESHFVGVIGLHIDRSFSTRGAGCARGELEPLVLG